MVDMSKVPPLHLICWFCKKEMPTVQTCLCGANTVLAIAPKDLKRLGGEMK